MVRYEFSLCIGQANTDSGITVKCHDDGISFLIKLMVCRQVSKWRSKEEAFTIPEGSKVILKISKPDKTKCLISGTVKAEGVLFKSRPEAFTVAGISEGEVSVYGPDGRRATTATFNIDVPEECVCNCDVESEPYIDIIGEQIKAAKDAEAGAKAAAEEAKKAQVNTPKIGENDNWFVWDATKGEYIDTNVKASGSINASISKDDVPLLGSVINLDALVADIVGKVDANKNIKLTKKTLPDGVYTYTYEDANTNTTVIGTVTIATNV